MVQFMEAAKRAIMLNKTQCRADVFLFLSKLCQQLMLTLE